MCFSAELKVRSLNGGRGKNDLRQKYEGKVNLGPGIKDIKEVVCV